MTKKWKMQGYLPGGVGMPSYDGYCECYGETEEEAIEDAKRRIRRTHGNREIRVESIAREIRS